MNTKISFFIQRYFSAYLINQKNYGQNTISSYRDTFRLLLKYFIEEGYNLAKMDISEIDCELILLFLDWLKENRNNVISTRNTRLAHLKSFFGYIMIIAPELSDLCSSVINISLSRTDSKPPKSLNEKEITHLLHSIDIDNKEGLRHLAILSLLYDSGCRVQELIDLNVEDAQIKENKTLNVRGKGRKYRKIPLLPKTSRVLQRYISEYNLTEGEILFSNKQNQRLSRQGIRYILLKYRNQVLRDYPDELSEGISPHLLRHSKATHLINAGVNIYNIRDFLGHSSVVTKEIYLTSNPEVTRKAIENYSNKTVSESNEFYSEKEQAELMDFLNTLV